MFDEKTQHQLDRMNFVQCTYCKKHFLKRGVPGSSVLTIRQHARVCPPQSPHEGIDGHHNQIGGYSCQNCHDQGCYQCEDPRDLY